MKKYFILLAILLMFPAGVDAASCGGSVCPSGTCTAIVDPSGGGDYASLASAENDCQGDLTAGGANQVFDCRQSGASTDTTQVIFVGWTTALGNEITVTGANDPHGGEWNIDAYVIKDAISTSTISIQENYINFIEIQAGSAVSSTGSYVLFAALLEVANAVLFDKCIITRDSGCLGYGLGFNDGDIIVTIQNSIIQYLGTPAASTRDGILLQNVSDAYIYNTITTGWVSGIERDAGNATVTNSVSFNNTDDYEGTFTAITNSASDDTQAGAGNIDWDNGATDWNRNFRDYANGDFRVKNASADIYNAGTDLSGSGVTDDIRGVARPQFRIYDIGAFEYTGDNSRGWTGTRWNGSGWNGARQRWR
jgi:hypothetical protein